MTFLAIDIGNTRIHVGAYVDDKLIARASAACDTPDEVRNVLVNACREIESKDPLCVILGSVNPPVADHVTELLRDIATDLPIRRVERDAPVPIGRQLDVEAIVGEDRLLNAAAAYDTLKQACVVIDTGTAVTVDYVDGAGTFHGGAISPGLQMLLDTMHAHAKQLPQVVFERPDEPIGHNTVDAMRSAAFHGVRGLVRELTEQYAEFAGAYPFVIATGGDAETLFTDYDLVDRIVPDLTLAGLALTLKTAIKKEDGDDEDDSDQ